MIHDVRVIRSALKHGRTAGEVHRAWCEYVRDRIDLSRQDQSVHVRVGMASDGTMLEMLGAWDESREEWRVFHAMTPKATLIRFMGLE